LLNHARKLSSLIIKLNEINNKLLDNDIPQIAQNMLLKLNLGFEEKVRKAAQVKQWFFVSIIALIVVLIIIWNKERSALTQLRNHAKELQLAGNVFKETHEGIMVTDSQKKILDVNPAFSEITGYSKDEIIGKDPKILSSGKQSKDFYQTMWNWLNEHDFWKGEIWNRNKGGELYAQVLTISVIRNTYGDIINYVGIFSDITAQKEQHEKLQLMAHYDLLTKLPNRALLSDRFNQAVAHSKRTSTQLAICFIDLDHFKPINDTYGHEIGDQLLIQVANRIKSSIREEDTVSRQGGDEFVLLISDVESVDECNYLMDRIHKNLAEPYLINDVTHTISASSGLTLFPSDDGDLDTLLRHADHAMYKAKQSGRNRMSLFNPELDQEQFARHHQLNAIELGLENNEFVLHYQPKISMVTGQVVGCEALIRWQPTNGQIIPPCEFLPIIDGTDVEIALGNWVIEQALFQIETWLEAGVELEVSVNISSHHLLSEGFIDSLQQQLTLHPTVNTRLLQIEVLESSALGDLDTVRKILNHCLYELGVKIALDDFGTGYSSLTHLRNLPVDTIKIDQSFVRNMINDINDYVIIDGVIALSSSFGRSVIAEGVETIEHGMMLLLMGCEFAQGYAISKPLEPEHFITWLHDFILPPEWKELSAMPLNQEKKETTLFGLVSDEWASIYKKQRILRV
jgi:diguanylate cyclase (GGDEF)-like protein/PAS domain S-box-containing protein